MMKSLLTILLFAFSIAAQTVTVVPGTSHQTMRGWQASTEVGCHDFPVSCQNYKAAAVQAGVDIGINRVRVGLLSGSHENTTDYWQLFLDANSDSPHSTRDTWAANRRVPVNDNGDPNSINASGFKWAALDWQLSEVVDPMRTALAARGETLYLVATFVHFSASNQLHIDTPAEYGEFILATWDWFTANKGYVPDALEIFLEPDNTAAVTPAEMAAMIIAARDRLVGAGYAKPRFIAPSTVSGPNADNFYLDIKTANATAAGYIDEIGYHRYVNIDNTNLATLRSLADTDGKDLSMSEFGGGTYLHLWDDLETGRNTAWEQYAISYPSASSPTPGYQHFLVGGSPTYTLTQEDRSKYIQMIFKYIRYGAVGKGVTNSGSTCRGLPFQNSNGTYVVILKATGSVTCTIEDLPPGTYGRRRTQGDGTNAPASFDSDLGNATVTTTEDVTFAFTAAGVGAIYDVNYLQGPAQPGKKLKGVKMKGVRL